MKVVTSYSQQFSPALAVIISSGIFVVIIMLIAMVLTLENWLNGSPSLQNNTQESSAMTSFALATSSPAASPSPGTERTDPTGIAQVWVPAGCFMMGSSDEQIQEAYTEARKLDKNARIDWFTMEKPQHETCLTQGYWIDKYVVTNTTFEAFVKAGGYSNDRYWSDEGLAWKRENNVNAPAKVDWNNQECSQYSSDPQQPRICIAWYEAEAYAKWRSETAKDGLIYRLPSEAEWEYAARGPEARIYPWGNIFDETLFNFCDKNCPFGWADKTVDDGYSHTSPVDHYSGGISWINAYDMAGNVWQWTADCYDRDFYSKRPDPDNNPLNACSDNTPRVIHGGSWDHNQILARSASRGGADPFMRFSNFGFRLVAALPES
jgi:formylglycine-generating enzyme required for sulfatase activity